MEKKRVAVYPFSRAFVSPCEFLGALSEAYAVAALVAPRGWSMEGRDGGAFDGREPLGLTVGSDLEGALASCDALLVPPGEHGASLRQKTLQAMERAAVLGKDILCALELSPEELGALRALCTRSGADLRYDAGGFEQETAGSPSGSRALNGLDTPVVYVGELLAGLHAEDILLSLVRAFRERGYRASGVLDRCYAGLFSLHPMPSFLKEGAEETDKIYRFNAYLKQLEQSERPDVLFVQLPGGMLKYNDQIPNDFGVYGYLISQAVQPDCFVLSVPYGQGDPAFYAGLSDCFAKRFGFEIDCAVMSTLEMDALESAGRGKTVFHCQDIEAVKRLTRGMNASETPVYPGLCGEGRRAAEECLFQALTGNRCARAI